MQTEPTTDATTTTKHLQEPYASPEQQEQKQKQKKQREEKCMTIIHFNDCYNIEPGPKSSGAAGFLTAVNQYRHLDPLIFFSGDIISPSFMSTFTKGEQMIPVLNDIGVHCAVFGNHEFDYGVDNLVEFTKRTTFPWLLSNVIDKETSNQLGDGQVYHIIEKGHFKIGLIGLIEEEWLSTLSTLDSSDVIYQDFVTRGRELAQWLKSEPNNVDYVIALTHFRTPNDIRLSDSVPEIDLILGGHDHDYEIVKRPNSYIVKSGTDFREFSLITLKLNQEAQYDDTIGASVDTNINSSPTNTVSGGEYCVSDIGSASKFTVQTIDIERICCASYPPDIELANKLEKFVTTIDEKMGKVLAQFNCDLDGRFSSIRRFETNLGNFVTDIMLASTHADLAILNSGTLRSDRIHPKGDFTMRDLFNILGYIDPIAVLEATGKQIWRALENGVSQWPKLEGRFPQVSGCVFTFDPNKPIGQRIDPKDIYIGDEPLDLDKSYRLTTKAYLASGKDGYDVFKSCKILVPGDESPDLTASILNHFEAINIVKSNRRTHHRQSIICLSRSSIMKLLNHQNSSSVNSNNSGSCQNNNQNNDVADADHVLDGDVERDVENGNGFGNNTAGGGGATCDLSYDQTSCIRSSSDEINEIVPATAPPPPVATSVVVGRGKTNNTRRMLSINDDNNNSSSNNNNNNDNNENNNTDRLHDDSAAEGNCDKSHNRHLTTSSLHIINGYTNSDNNENDDLIKAPAASSPLLGVTAPTPTLRNMANAITNDVSSYSKDITMSLSSPPPTIQRKPRTKRVMSLLEMEYEQCKLEPKIEGRIRIVGVNV